MVLLAAETGLRGGEHVAVRPHYLDASTATLTIQDVYIEGLQEELPHRDRMILRHCPKDNEPRALRITTQLTAALATRIETLGIAPERLFANQAGQPIPRSTFRARVWRASVDERRQRTPRVARHHILASPTPMSYIVWHT